MIGALMGLNKATEPITAVGNILDELFTSDEEKLDKKIALQRLSQRIPLVQAEINKVEASHRSLFVSGWRPFIGWTCGINLAYLVVVRDQMIWASGIWFPNMVIPPPVGLDMTIELVVALLGLSTLRSFEKHVGKAK